jgi:hypothetical protein
MGVRKGAGEVWGKGGEGGRAVSETLREWVSDGGCVTVGVGNGPGGAEAEGKEMGCESGCEERELTWV